MRAQSAAEQGGGGRTYGWLSLATKDSEASQTYSHQPKEQVWEKQGLDEQMHIQGGL